LINVIMCFIPFIPGCCFLSKRNVIRWRFPVSTYIHQEET